MVIDSEAIHHVGSHNASQPRHEKFEQATRGRYDIVWH